MRACTYCGCDVDAHDPLTVRDEGGVVGHFCNFGCLRAHIDDEELATGTTCNWGGAT